MNTPVHDFIEAYRASGAARFHMPGHKGVDFSGCEPWDITEIGGADNLYAPEGIIRESEENAAALFGAGSTLYSTEGSSQCIRAMLYLAMLAFAGERPGVKPAIAAGRNVHKAFLTAAALLDFEIVWLFPENREYSLCRCDISEVQLEKVLKGSPNIAGVYLTSPDYLGNMADVQALARTARRFGAPLLVDNAHGAYLRFLPSSRHPMDLGAAICCDSAHKTLPVLTGGAYLHIAKTAPAVFHSRAKSAMSLFGSTSPSYLILRSLDRANPYLAGPYPKRLEETAAQTAALKARLAQRGWRFLGDEPLKLTLDAKSYGWTGPELAEALERQRIICEYADPDYVVLMPTPENPPDAFARLEAALAPLDPRAAAPAASLRFPKPERRMPVREALFLPSETVPIAKAVGRTAASLSASCPPAISPAVPGEAVSRAVAEIYRYYGISEISVLGPVHTKGNMI